VTPTQLRRSARLRGARDHARLWRRAGACAV